MIILLNAFSANMIPPEWKVAQIMFIRVPCPRFDDTDKVISYIGHQDLARIVSNMVGVNVPVSRSNFSFNHGSAGDEIYIASYRGERLPKGATELPPNATIEWWRVCIM